MLAKFRVAWIWVEAAHLLFEGVFGNKERTGRAVRAKKAFLQRCKKSLQSLRPTFFFFSCLFSQAKFFASFRLCRVLLQFLLCFRLCFDFFFFSLSLKGRDVQIESSPSKIALDKLTFFYSFGSKDPKKWVPLWLFNEENTLNANRVLPAQNGSLRKKRRRPDFCSNDQR